MKTKFTTHMKAAAILLAATGLSLSIIYGCKKSDTNNGDGSETTPKSRDKEVIFSLKQDCNIGNVTVTCNGVSKFIKNYTNTGASCGDSLNYASFILKPGKYHFEAKGATGSLRWESDFDLTEDMDKCALQYQLTCDGVTPLLHGMAGPLRFNLVHSGNGVDFDLFVQTPDDKVISIWNRKEADGYMDIISNCIIGDDSSPSTASKTFENLSFSSYAQHGTYKMWVVYAGACPATPPSSGSYTLKVLNGLSTVQTLTGTLTTTNPKSTVYSYTY